MLCACLAAFALGGGLGETYEETFDVNVYEGGAGRRARAGTVFNFTMTRPLVDRAAGAPLRYDLFPKMFSQAARHVGLRRMELTLKRGAWRAEWGSARVSAPPATSLRASFAGGGEGGGEVDHSWNVLVHHLSGLTCSSLNFLAIPSPDSTGEGAVPYARAAILKNVSGWGYYGDLPAEETVCTENLTPLLSTTPTRGRDGLGRLVAPLSFFGTRYHSLHLLYAAAAGGETLTVLFEAVHDLGPADPPADGSRFFTRAAGSGFELADAAGFGCSLCTSSQKVRVFAPCGVAVSGGAPAEPGASGGSARRAFSVPAGGPVRWGPAAAGDSCSPSEEAAGLSFGVQTFATEVGDAGGVLSVAAVFSRAVGPGGSLLRVLLPVPRDMLNPHPARLRYLVDETSCHGAAQQQGLEDPIWLPLSSPCGAAVSAGTLLLDVALPVPERACRVFLTLPFDKNILPLSRYPPDANRLYYLPSVAVWLGGEGPVFNTKPAGVTMPTPDFSMPFNIITLSCTAISLLFGLSFSYVTKDFRSS
ncbi:GPI transamidase component PIG-T-like protein [Diplonema papillatum]|nr:GPI transamidase component PIG-T-like protein [Diplonema papillatum]